MVTTGAPARRRNTPPSPPSSGVRRGVALAAGLAALVLVPTGQAAAEDGQDSSIASHVPGTDSAVASTEQRSRYDVSLAFDEIGPGGSPRLQSSGLADVVATVSSANGGEVRTGPDRSAAGHSLRTEHFRGDAPAAPAVVVVTPRAGEPDPTDPGRGDFVFGADLVLDAATGTSATDNGENLVQRGLASNDRQYKLQVDNRYPSCYVRGSAGSVAVRAAQPLRAEQWHRLRCRRVGDEVTLRVVTFAGDSREVSEYTGSGETGSLSYPSGGAPFSIGGKVDDHGDVLARDSDQFNGLVDDVVFRRLS